MRANSQSIFVIVLGFFAIWFALNKAVEAFSDRPITALTNQTIISSDNGKSWSNDATVSQQNTQDKDIAKANINSESQIAAIVERQLFPSRSVTSVSTQTQTQTQTQTTTTSANVQDEGLAYTTGTATLRATSVPVESPVVKTDPFVSVTAPGVPGKAQQTQDVVVSSDKLVIGQINVDAPIVIVNNTSSVNDAHRYGVVHYPGTAFPGQIGSILLSGHSSAIPWQKGVYDTVFAKLNDLQTGNTFTIKYNGQNYTYRIFKKYIVYPSEFRLNDYGTETVTLVSCWPVGTDLKRIVIEAERIS